MPDKEFKDVSETMLTFLKKKRNDWERYIDSHITKTHLNDYRAPIKSLRYIKNIFKTKPRTLVFQMTNYPNVIIKIDNRKAETFDSEKKLINYFTALLKRRKRRKRIHNLNIYICLKKMVEIQKN